MNNQQAEEDYDKNKANPKPSQEAIDEPDDKKAGLNVNRVIIISIIVLIIAFFFIFKNYNGF